MMYKKVFISYAKEDYKFAIELSGYYNSASFSGNSRSYGMVIFNLGIKKDLPDNKGSFQLSVSDLFRAASYRNRLGRLVTDSFKSDVITDYQAESHSFPIIKLSYSRSFGAGSKKQTSNKKPKEEMDRL
jgi:hypothetical protein